MKKILHITSFAIGIVLTQTLFAQTTITLKPTQDASVGFQTNAGSANNNYGHADYFGAFSQDGVFGGLNNGRGIMSFDLSGIPPGSTIVKATLRLFGRGPYGEGDGVSHGDTGVNRCLLKRITSPWQQYVVTWKIQPSTTDMDEVFLHQSTGEAENYPNIDVTQLVADMYANPGSSFGFEIRLQKEQPIRSLAFWSTDSPDPSLWPHLVITYKPATNLSATASYMLNNNQNSSSNIYPDPVVSNATIQLNFSNQQSNLKVSIIDLTGKVIRIYNLTSNELTFNREGIANGLYFYKVLNVAGNAISRGKFIIQ